MFLDNIWLIPMFPLCGALLMLLFGRRLDPQGVHGDDAHEPPAGKKLISLLCPGMILIAFLFSLGAIIELTSVEGHSHEVVVFTWLAGLKSATAAGGLGSVLVSEGSEGSPPLHANNATAKKSPTHRTAKIYTVTRIGSRWMTLPR